MRYFWVRIALKALSYTSAIVIFLLCLNAVYLSSVLHHPLFSSAILVKSTDSLRASWFWSIIAYIGTIATMSLLLAEIQQYMGYGVLRNFFTGRYHEPVQEERIFMFVDMKSSTTLPEEMGHVRYFALLNRYYAVISSAIADNNGVILQYVGDEIVITWTLDSGVRDQDCLFDEITLEENQCLSCHSLEKANEKNAPKIGESHLVTEGVKQVVSMSRYQCTSCHVPQADASPLVENAFVGNLTPGK